MTRPKTPFEIRFKIPRVAGTAAEYIQTQSAVLGESVASDVGFLKQAQAGESARVRELMPRDVAHTMKVHPGNELFKECAEARGVGQGFSRAPVRLYNPLTAGHY